MVLLHVTEEIVQGILDVHGEYLRSARKLNLSSNGIRRIDNLGKLNPYLTKLDLSFNDLEDVRALQSLTLLEELNLSGNCLTSAAFISHMTSLQCLDVSKNKIMHLKDIQVLNVLPKLTVLKLADNPICESSLLYPHAIFAALPTLEVIDDWSREDFMKNYHSSLASPSPELPQQQIRGTVMPSSGLHPSILAQTPSPVGMGMNSTAVSASHNAQLQQQLSYMQAENAAYVDMFRVIEKKLGQRAPKEIISDSEGRIKPDIDIILSYPYTDLLNLWRQKVHSLTLQGILDAQKTQSLQNKILKMEQAAREEQESQSQTEKTLRARLQAAEQLIAAQAEELTAVHTALADSVAEQEELERTAAEHKKQDEHVRRFLNAFRAKVDQQMVASNLLEVKLQKRLQSFSSRFAACQDRLVFLQNLNAQKNIQMRNTAAAFEAEKRLLREWTAEEIRRRTHSEKTSTNPEIPSSSVNFPGAFAPLSDTHMQRLTAECEAFLRSVFRQLDPDDSGTVQIRLLLQCLHTAAARGLLRCSHSVPFGSEVGACLTARESKSESNEDSSDIWAKLIHGLEQLVNSLQSGDAEDITWGEFLLLLCPSSHPHQSGLVLRNGNKERYERNEWDMFDDKFDQRDYNELHLSPSDHRNLHNSKLLGDLDWAMIPLSLPSSAFEGDESALIPTTWLRTVLTGGYGVEFDMSRLKKEAIRLARERAFLMRRLQTMSRSLERRAISIRSYFGYELRKLTLKNESVQRSLRDSQVYVGELEERLKLISADLQRERDEKTIRIEQLTSQVADLQAQLLNSSSHEEMNSIEQILEEFKNKLKQSESELRIVQKELNKAELARKTLQRDLKRHQATEKASKELLEDYKAKYKEQKRTSLTLEEEQVQLLNRLTDAEKSIETLKEKQQEKEKEKIAESLFLNNHEDIKDDDEHLNSSDDHIRQSEQKESVQASCSIEHKSQEQEKINRNQPRVLDSSAPHDVSHNNNNDTLSRGYASDYMHSTSSRTPPTAFHHVQPASSRSDKMKNTEMSGPLRSEALPFPSQGLTSGLALESMARKLRMMAESLND